MFYLYDEYPFSILDIAHLLRLTIRRELSDSVYVDCPFCQKRKGKLNLNLAKDVWRRVDLPNLNEYILPTRNRADIILHKTTNHKIDRIYLRED